MRIQSQISQKYQRCQSTTRNSSSVEIREWGKVNRFIICIFLFFLSAQTENRGQIRRVCKFVFFFCFSIFLLISGPVLFERWGRGEWVSDSRFKFCCWAISIRVGYLTCFVVLCDKKWLSRHCMVLRVCVGKIRTGGPLFSVFA